MRVSRRRRFRPLLRRAPLVVAALLVVATPLASPSATATTSSGVAQNVEPSLGAPLTLRMSTLFRAIATASVATAAPLFFPQSAYVAMKTGQIPAPATDYHDRLLAFYRLDLATYHQRLDPRATATFIGVNVSGTRAGWIPAGDCENSIGYWHVPGVRLVYRLDGVVRSVAVDSLISWRGVWYVVHLGPNPRPENVGTLDAPASGSGAAGPPGGC